MGQPEGDAQRYMPFPMPDLTDYVNLATAPCVEPTPDELQKYSMSQLIDIIEEWLIRVQGINDIAWHDPIAHRRQALACFYSSDPLPNSEIVIQFRRVYTAWVTYVALYLKRAATEETQQVVDSNVVSKLELVAVLMAALADVSECSEFMSEFMSAFMFCFCVLRSWQRLPRCFRDCVRATQRLRTTRF